jgi:O-antigen/teichoic acid export membrane protein
VSPLKNVFFMATSTGIRLVFGLVTFSVLARQLGPTHFGQLMLWLSVATLAGLGTNFGFGPYLLRELGLQQGRAQVMFEEVLSAKLIVLLVVGAIALSAGALFLSGDVGMTFTLLLGMQLADSLTDFLNVGYRATNRFGSETRIATVSAVIQFAIVFGVVWHWPDMLAAASALMASRLVVLFMTWIDQRRHMPGLKPRAIRAGLVHLKASAIYASDFVLQSLLGLIDSPILNHYLGPVAVGIHQAGMRLFQGGNQMAVILGNVFIPRLAQAYADKPRLQKEGSRLQTAYFVAGAGFGLTLAIAAQPLTQLLFGSEFLGLVPLMPWFGLLFYLRFIASSFGVLLTATGAQNLRTRANLLHWLLILGAATWLIPNYRNTGWLVALCLGTLLLIGIYFAAAIKLVKLSIPNAVLALAGIASFYPWLSLPKA